MSEHRGEQNNREPMGNENYFLIDFSYLITSMCVEKGKLTPVDLIDGDVERLRGLME